MLETGTRIERIREIPDPRGRPDHGPPPSQEQGTCDEKGPRELGPGP